ncbi:unnamed protein product [Peronospora destructor]|uniref:PWI domain-containing protein n=1 Tax=Peronospora destructor TaxID=86335 RepID=A0AAV0V1P8_9STRA|nr:unnamed protein product [Peronospora destructor]
MFFRPMVATPNDTIIADTNGAIKFTGLKMAAAYATYAIQVSDALQTLVKTTGVKVDPAVEFVSCDSGLHEHFVPKTSLEKHLRKCHGERGPRPINNPAFFYGKRIEEEDAVIAQDTFTTTVSGTADIRVRSGTEGIHDGLQSLLEPEAGQYDQQKGTFGAADGDGVIAAVGRAASSAGTFYEQVQAWQRIPRAFAMMKDSERELVTPSSLCRWLKAELSRPGVLPSDAAFDDELVEYMAGLLEHPDFCQPDLLVLELHEFLGSNVFNIVLALWKFLVVEIGLQSVFQTEKSGEDVTIQVKSSVKSHNSATMDVVLKNVQTQPSDANAEHNYKRRRASYKGKVGTKTGLEAYRDMIQKHMVELSLEMNRELVLGGGFRDEKKCDRGLSTAEQSRPEAVNWLNFTDALEVRNRIRSRRHDQSSSRKRQWRSRSRERSNVCGKYGAEDNACRKGRTSPDKSGGRSSERSRRMSRRRSRSPRYRDYHDAKYRDSYRKMEQDRSDRRCEYRH